MSGRYFYKLNLRATGGDRAGVTYDNEYDTEDGARAALLEHVTGASGGRMNKDGRSGSYFNEQNIKVIVRIYTIRR